LPEAADPHIFIVHVDAVISDDDNIPELNANCGSPGVTPRNGIGVATVVVIVFGFVPVSKIFSVGATR
jgi:hypothetical protein